MVVLIIANLAKFYDGVKCNRRVLKIIFPIFFINHFKSSSIVKMIVKMMMMIRRSFVISFWGMSRNESRTAL